MHESYESKLGHPADFRVKYRFYEQEEGGRKQLPFQGIRSDFWYDHEHHDPRGLFIIWPEFEDGSGNIILDNTIPVPKAGTARMWIIVNQRRSYHQQRIKAGIIGYFREGERTTGICEVIEIIGLMTNPTE